MEFTTQQINRETVEGKLLFAALIELTTRLHTNWTPDEVIKRLWEIHKNTETANVRTDCGVASPVSLFQTALNRSVQKTKDQLNTKARDLSGASETILGYAAPSMNPDDFCSLEDLLVKLYRHHMNL